MRQLGHQPLGAPTCDQDAQQQPQGCRNAVQVDNSEEGQSLATYGLRAGGGGGSSN